MKKICILIAAVFAMVSPVSAQIVKKFGEGFKNASKGAKIRTNLVNRGFENRIKAITILGAAASSQQQRDDDKNMGLLNNRWYSPAINTFGPKIEKERLPFSQAMWNVSSMHDPQNRKRTPEMSVLDSAIIKTLTEKGCDSCMVLITDLQTGELVYHYGWSPFIPSCPAIMRAVVYLAALEHGAKPSDIVDTKDGQYVYANTDTIRDSNWRIFGEMTLDCAFSRNSDVAMAMAIDKYLPNKYETLDAFLNMMGLTELGEIKDYRTLKQAQMEPFRMVKWMKAVANGYLPNVSAASLRLLRDAMQLHVGEGRGKGAKGARFPLAGMTFVTNADDMPSPIPDRVAIFIGFFPADNPCYSVYAEVHRKSFITGKIPAEICKDIVNAMPASGDGKFSVEYMMRKFLTTKKLNKCKK